MFLEIVHQDDALAELVELPMTVLITFSGLLALEIK